MPSWLGVYAVKLRNRTCLSFPQTGPSRGPRAGPADNPTLKFFRPTGRDMLISTSAWRFNRVRRQRIGLVGSRDGVLAHDRSKRIFAL